MQDSSAISQEAPLVVFAIMWATERGMNARMAPAWGKMDDGKGQSTATARVNGRYDKVSMRSASNATRLVVRRGGCELWNDGGGYRYH